MPTSTITYKGALRTEAIHVESGTLIQSDAPKDNMGLGEAFSPTDLLATSLGSCILTTIGIVGRRETMTAPDGAVAEVKKVMYPEPRRVGEIHVHIRMPKVNYSEKEKKIYENAAHTCPVAKSLHPDLKQVIEFTW